MIIHMPTNQHLVWQTCLVTFYRGDPPECGKYLVTDGDEFGVDAWWEEVDGRIRLGSQIGKPHSGKVVRKWMRHDNIIAWAQIRLPNAPITGQPQAAPCPSPLLDSSNQGGHRD